MNRAASIGLSDFEQLVRDHSGRICDLLRSLAKGGEEAEHNLDFSTMSHTLPFRNVTGYLRWKLTMTEQTNVLSPRSSA